jgi:hypothetical protein
MYVEDVLQYWNAERPIRGVDELQDRGSSWRVNYSSNVSMLMQSTLTSGVGNAGPSLFNIRSSSTAKVERNQNTIHIYISISLPSNRYCGAILHILEVQPSTWIICITLQLVNW